MPDSFWSLPQLPPIVSPRQRTDYFSIIPHNCSVPYSQAIKVLTSFFREVASNNLQIRLIESLADMKLLARSHTRLQRPASLLNWHSWFAWYPVVVRVDGELKHWVWLESLERKWSHSRDGDRKGHWRYRYPVIHVEHYAEQYDLARDGSEERVPPDRGGREARPGESRLH